MKVKRPGTVPYRPVIDGPETHDIHPELVGMITMLLVTYCLLSVAHRTTGFFGRSVHGDVC